jgi:hypothetical protein
MKAKYIRSHATQQQQRQQDEEEMEDKVAKTARKVSSTACCGLLCG